MNSKESIPLAMRRKRMTNPRTQFELKTFSGPGVIDEAYEWCIRNLPLKGGKGIIYQVDELYIITSSQSVVDKVNDHFGSNFGFGVSCQRYYYLA